jgi:hypothetical protein
MGADQLLIEGIGPDLSVSESQHDAMDARRRLAAEIAGRVSFSEIEPWGRSRGRSR